ncbi:MAG: hypothetical protein WBC22_19810 [Sedimentisphaerales bacterium]
MVNKALFWQKKTIFFHFGVLMTNKASFCASLRLIRTVFSWFLKKAISMALWTKAITCDKAGFKSRFCQEHQAGKNIISVNPVILSNFSSCFCAFLWPKNPFNQRNPRLMNYLHAFGIFTLVKMSLQIRLFMQNEPNFRKSQMAVNKEISKVYEKKDTWWSGKNEPKTNPNEPKRTQTQKGQNERNFYYYKGL